MPESQFKALEQKIDDLISLCAELNQENVSLKADKETWRSEREVLVSRNELARHKVETILNRLRTLEQT
jgi:cell division protein ZapB